MTRRALKDETDVDHERIRTRPQKSSMVAKGEGTILPSVSMVSARLRKPSGFPVAQSAKNFFTNFAIFPWPNQNTRL